VLKILSYAFTSCSGLIIVLHKYTAVHKYWILKTWCIARLPFTFHVEIILKRPWRNPFEEKRL